MTVVDATPAQPLAVARRLLHHDRRRVSTLAAFALATGLLETASLYLIARTASILAAGSAATDSGTFGFLSGLTVTETALAAIGVIAVSLIFSYLTARGAANLSYSFIRRSRAAVVAAYFNAAWEQRANEREGRLQQIGTEFTQRAEIVVQQSTQLVVTILSIGVLVIAAAVVAPVATALLGAVVVVLGLVSRLFRTGARPGAAVAILRANRELSTALSQSARLSQEIESFDVAEPVTAELTRQIGQGADGLRHVRLHARLQPSVYQAIALSLVALTAVAISRFHTGSTSEFAPLLLLFVRALAYGKQMQAARHTLNEYLPFAIELESALSGLGDMARGPRSESALVFSQIEVRDVTFGYDGLPPVLNGVDLTINAGDFVGIVGPSGAGKSTLASMLVGLRSPTAGDILMDGVALGDIQRRHLSSMIAVVPQENKLIHGTIAENIAFYRGEITWSQTVEAAKAAHLHDEILAMPDGYDSVVGPGARELSGGQRQRLGIARALANWPQMLVLDEPTSALDAASEAYVQQTLTELAGAITIIIVAHRAPTLRLCTHLVRVEHGAASMSDVRSGLPLDLASDAAVL